MGYWLLIEIGNNHQAPALPSSFIIRDVTRIAINTSMLMLVIPNCVTIALLLNLCLSRVNMVCHNKYSQFFALSNANKEKKWRELFATTDQREKELSKRSACVTVQFSPPHTQCKFLEFPDRSSVGESSKSDFPFLIKYRNWSQVQHWPKGLDLQLCFVDESWYNHCGRLWKVNPPFCLCLAPLLLLLAPLLLNRSPPVDSAFTLVSLHGSCRVELVNRDR